MKKLCGYDLNGWRDQAARNWVLHTDGEEVEVAPTMIESGLLGVLVDTGQGTGSELIGGAQAWLAPHGLGDGWGEIGRARRRAAIRDLLTEGTASVEQLAAALKGLASDASFGVVSLDDIPDTSEVLQERLLAALRKIRVSTPLLVWRSVLVALYAIEQGQTARDQTVGVVCQTARGFSVQRLKIRAERGRGGDILAPERKASGMLLPSNWGYERLAQRARDAVVACSISDRTEHLAWARATGCLLLGFPTKPEVLRRSNGDWEVLTPPSSLELEGLALPDKLAEELDGCDSVLFESLAEGGVHSALASEIAAALSRSVEVLPPTGVAEGALIAARRHSRREPVFFDFLPQISTIVQRPNGAESYDLIDPDTTLPAGDIYRSPRPARFAIQAGQDSFSIFLRKETAERPRKARVDIGLKLEKAVPVDLWVEQSPAAGRAKISLQSDDLGHQFRVEWDFADELPESWDELLEIFKQSKPTIPARLVLPCGMGSWNDSPRGDGLHALLEKNDDREVVDWASLAAKLSARPEGQYAISSDGDLPAGIGEAARDRLDRLTQRALANVRDRLSGRALGDNDSLRFLTWQFRRCPAEVAGWLLEALDQEVRGHRLFTRGPHWKLAYQGLGRVVASRNLEHQAIHKLMGKTIDKWSWQRESAAMAFLLSRSETAPRLLTRKDVDWIGRRVMKEFDENLGSSYTRFQYAPLLLVGLLRWRVAEPFALVAGQDPLADKLARSVEKTLADLRRPGRGRPLAKFGRILEQTLDELRGEGTNPELLLDIYAGGEAVDADV
ncbi:hypothetical protein [Sinorhizobium meliloti]|uniref:hypothetical protein n=1 Tax=Rhizobium meliloti TaxID=382 RepID=UPI000FD9B71D|nr:hypothetical protein [Sinorhizobium meliloti]RVK31046.1 hypothetical protein CN163_26785 [Sinorhizobium meliloti]